MAAVIEVVKLELTANVSTSVTAAYQSSGQVKRARGFTSRTHQKCFQLMGSAQPLCDECSLASSLRGQ